MSILRLDNVSKAFGTRQIFKDVSFQVEDRDKMGLVGVNGAGKTTLFRIILDEMAPDTGVLTLSRDCTVGRMEQHLPEGGGRTVLEEALTVFSHLKDMERELAEISRSIDEGDTSLVARQHVLSQSYEDQGGFTYLSRVRSALCGLGFSPRELDKPVSLMSGGQKTRVMLCKILMSGANLLLLDEPTNHLDIASVEWLEDFLRAYRGAYIIISHDRYFLDRVTDKTLELENERLTVYPGGYTAYVRLKEEALLAASRKYENTQKEITRLEGIIRQQRQWNRERNIRMAESKQKAADRLREGLEAPDDEPDGIRFRFPAAVRSGVDVLVAQGMGKSFDGRLVFKNAALHLRRGDKAFLLGPNGCGKTTLLKRITGRLEGEGALSFGANVTVGYYEQLLSELSPEKTVQDEVWDAHPRLPMTQIRNALAAFLFKGSDVEKRVGSLSGGEKARVSLLKLMLAGDNLLLLDEPTNHLDIASREALEQALADYDGTLLIVSHDRYLINKIGQRIFHMEQKGITAYEGDYDAYLQKRARAAQMEAPPKEPPKPSGYRQRKEAEAQKRRRLSRIQKAETAIGALEEDVAALEQALAAPENAAVYEKVLELSGLLEQKRTALDAQLELWTKLNEEDA